MPQEMASFLITQETPECHRQRWNSMRVLNLTMFLSSAGFSLSMSSIWPYLQSVDSSATTTIVGAVVAGFSIGQLGASFVFGYWYNYTGRAKMPVLLAISTGLVGYSLYTAVSVIPVGGKWILIISRLLIGAGAGNLILVRAYIPAATTLKERTSALANDAASQALGFVAGPVIQTAFVPLGDRGPIHTCWFRLNMYTAPGFLLIFLDLLNILLVITVFNDYTIDDGSEDSYKKAGLAAPLSLSYAPDRVAVAAGIAFDFILSFGFTVVETVGTPLGMNMFHWTNDTATLYFGISLACCGVWAITLFMLLKWLTKHFMERNLVFVGYACFCLGLFAMLPWGTDYTHLQPGDVENRTEQVLNKSLNISTSFGCHYQWCHHTPRIHLIQFFISMALLSTGYPVGATTNLALYSKILGPFQQGSKMALLSASGCVARILGPLFVGVVYQQEGPRLLFSLVCFVFVVTLIWGILIKRRLVPYYMFVRLKVSKKPNCDCSQEQNTSKV